jgi:hypothetical protein
VQCLWNAVPCLTDVPFIVPTIYVVASLHIIYQFCNIYLYVISSCVLSNLVCSFLLLFLFKSFHNPCFTLKTQNEFASVKHMLPCLVKSIFINPSNLLHVWCSLSVLCQIHFPTTKTFSWFSITYKFEQGY